jgi:predicted GIY-YIG superfamily endonuclease
MADADRHYTGRTTDVDARLGFHNAGLSRHTAKHRPWKVSVIIQFDDLERSVHFERYLKTGSGRAFAERHFSKRRALG